MNFEKISIINIFYLWNKNANILSIFADLLYLQYYLIYIFLKSRYITLQYYIIQLNLKELSLF